MANKTTLTRLKLDPYFSKTIETNLNVWSHDQNSYEIKFEFYDHQCDKPIDLTGADMRILLDHAGSQPKIYPLEVESKVLGLAKFIMPKEIRGCEGKFTAHIYADYPNRTHDFGSFTFYTKLSRLDGDLGGCMDEIYVSEFEKALEDIKEFKVDINEEISNMKNSINDINQQITDNNIVDKNEFETEINDIKSYSKALEKEVDDVKRKNDKQQEYLDVLPDEILRTGKPLDESVRYVAHRGNHSQYPENSIGAFESVREHWGIESDTQVTKDGHWVIMHDYTVDRMTDGKGRVDSLTLQEIRELKLKFPSNWTTKEGKIPEGWEKVPTFLEYLEICKNKSKIPVIEIKRGEYTSKNYDDFAEIVKNNISLDKIVVMSFDYNVLLEVRKRLKEVFVLYLSGSATKESVDRIYNDFRYRCGINISYSDGHVTKENVSYAHSKNMLFGVWTVPEEDFEKMNGAGVDIITTDSESSRLKRGKVTVVEPFASGNQYVHANSVVENANGTITLKLIVLNGTNKYRDLIGVLPDWATPIRDIWTTATIRTETGVEYATTDIAGRLFNDPSEKAYPGTINVGLGWENRHSWANIEVTYDLY